MMPGKSGRMASIITILAFIGLIVGVLCIYYSAGISGAVLSPLGILLIAGAALAISGVSRRAAREQAAQNRPRNPYARRREQIAAAAHGRETWPNDGSYCPHCGMSAREDDQNCRRCGGKISNVQREGE